jgi:Fe-S-cluster containining protein
MEKSELVQITRHNRIAEDEFLPFVNAMYEQVWGNLLPPQILTHDLSNTVAGNIITSADEPIPDCMTCGACCASFVCVDVKPDNPISSKDCWDITKQGETSEFTVDRFIKRKEEDFSCVALEGEIGKEVNCRVYENRPRMCRQFEAGSDRCRAVRRAYNIEPFLSLMEMFEARQKLDAQKSEIDNERIEVVNINEKSGTQNLQIFVTLKNGSQEIIHIFDAKFETWFQSEFEGLTLAQADELIINRTRKE